MHKELLKSNVVMSIQILQECEKLISERICQINKEYFYNKVSRVKLLFFYCH